MLCFWRGEAFPSLREALVRIRTGLAAAQPGSVLSAVDRGRRRVIFSAHGGSGIFFRETVVSRLTSAVFQLSCCKQICWDTECRRKQAQTGRPASLRLASASRRCSGRSGGRRAPGRRLRATPRFPGWKLCKVVRGGEPAPSPGEELETARLVEGGRRRLGHGGETANGSLAKGLQAFKPEHRQARRNGRTAGRSPTQARQTKPDSGGFVKQCPGRIPRGRGGSGAYGSNMVDSEALVKGFFHTRISLHKIEGALSRERLDPYRVAGDREKAIRLHLWNTGVSSAFYGPLQVLEITLRNAMHEQLVKRYGPACYDNAGLDKGALERLAIARSKPARSGDGGDPSVAALSFGFWVSLLGPGGRLPSGRKANYEMTLWRPALRQAFPHREKLTRKQAHSRLNDLRILRNKIAHHEPIFSRDLAKDHECILDAIGWMSPEMAAWTERCSRVIDSLALTGDGGEMKF